MLLSVRPVESPTDRRKHPLRAGNICLIIAMCQYSRPLTMITQTIFGARSSERSRLERSRLVTVKCIDFYQGFCLFNDEGYLLALDEEAAATPASTLSTNSSSSSNRASPRLQLCEPYFFQG
jgi:hypothetical protein